MTEDHDAEFAAVVEELQRAGFVTVGADAEGHETWTLTPTGEQIALQLSMSRTGAARTLPSALDAQAPALNGEGFSLSASTTRGPGVTYRTGASSSEGGGDIDSTPALKR